MKHIKKFNENEDITKKDASMDFEKDKPTDVSNDITTLDGQLDDAIKKTKLDGEWEIVDVVSVSMEPPTEDELKTNEAIVINAELGSKPVKRGDFIYITALINKQGHTTYVHQNQMGVIKVRIVEIYNSLLVLNQLK
jgi:hypothetical protein